MPTRTITIVGAGLTGSVLALFLAERGFDVELFDRGADPRSAPARRGRSINITLCERGLRALDAVGVGDGVRRIGVTAAGRVIHAVDGTRERQPYGNQGEALLSVSRAELNATLVEASLRHPRVRVAFDHRCTALDLDARVVTFEDRRRAKAVVHEFRHLIGADGAHSVVRAQLQRGREFRYSEELSPHGNKEILIRSGAPAARAEWTREADALHVWPRGEYMLIAFPNRDGSTTCTLQLPLRGEGSFESIRDAGDIERVFAKAFPDALPAIPDLAEQYFANSVIPMITVKCSPWSLGDRALLIGDAAHAIWPSYGQGANAGFEDCAVLDACLERHRADVGAAFADFEAQRKPHTDAIADLSMEHAHELRDTVGDPAFLGRKRIERAINRLFPGDYVPLYGLVSFTDTPYANARAIARRQQSVLDDLLSIPGIHEQLDSPDVARRIESLLRATRG